MKRNVIFRVAKYEKSVENPYECERERQSHVYSDKYREKKKKNTDLHVVHYR